MHRFAHRKEDVIERILRHLGLWQEGVRVHSGTDPPGETTLDPWLDDPFPDYDTELSWRSPPPERSGGARVRLSHPLLSGPQSSGGGLRRAPQPEKARV
jgi:hypothetical protein